MARPSRNLTTPCANLCRREKSKYAGKGIILIDDTPDVIEGFDAAGGIGILHKDVGRTLELLKVLLA